ncbi:MAG: hypothetical protein A3B96_02040 [Candidatus Spechtbacteria bacterium RIFCSPHIGHO2_02_FULL_43_15b]|nr:MAG: hypothetical protein A3B96_02040 [Candidatus Spechtbacteria bacterium RIFCSPHIGHO2_02_FULL_43_15b]
MVFIPKVNKVIKVLVATDVIIYSSWGLAMPIFAVFVLDSIKNGDEGVIGMTVGVYWVVKSILQMPIGKFLDREGGEGDDLWFMIIGTFIASFIPIGFIFASEPMHLYILEGIHAAAMAMVIPAWGGIFTRHMDKGVEAETWGVESSALGLGVGIAGIAGGFIAEAMGFIPLFIAVSVIGMFGTFMLLLIKKDMAGKQVSMMPLKHISHIK